jgi:CarD family transcriptional regulator
MEFSIGDKVMHPRFGAGTITGEAHRELVEGFEHYYVIHVAETGATAYVPIRMMEDLGVRRVMSRANFAQVFTTLQSTPASLSSDYKERQARVQEKLETRQPIQVAEVVRDLTWHKTRKHLTQKDTTLLNYGRELLASEMALAADSEASDAQAAMDVALRVDLMNHSTAQEGLPEISTTSTASPDNLVQQLFGTIEENLGVTEQIT